MDPDRRAITPHAELGPTDAVFVTVSYADVQNMPIELSELHKRLIGCSLSLLETSMAVDELISQGDLERDGDLVFLSGRSELIERQRATAEMATEVWTQAEDWAHRIGRLPLVRMVAVTGPLAVDNLNSGPDINFFIVTRPRRMWLTRRLILRVVRKAAKQDIVLNPKYVVTSRSSAMQERTLHLAHELAQMTAVVGDEVCQHVRRNNDWILDYLPNAATVGSRAHVREVSPSKAQKWAEWLLLLPPFKLVEARERRRGIQQLVRQARGPRNRGSPTIPALSHELCAADLLHDAAAADAALQQRLAPS